MSKSSNTRSLIKLLIAILPFVLKFFSSKKSAKTGSTSTGGFIGVEPDVERKPAKPFPEPSRSVDGKSDTERLLGREPEQFEDPIPELFDARQSDTMVTVVGRVVHLLKDDNEGSRHQRWLMDTPGGITLKISHNIDLAKRVPISEGDLVRVRGEYEWNDMGGVVHWTHHDPKGWHEDGWVEHEGVYYGTA
ncbi:MAG: DUF3465 domain-containing protein [Planctomycetota bacterium]